MPAGFFGGGGGGGFRASEACSSGVAGGGLPMDGFDCIGTWLGIATVGGCSLTGLTCFSRKLPSLPVTLNFLFHVLAFVALAEIWSW